MRFQVELAPVAEAQIEQAYQWYRDRNPGKEMFTSWVSCEYERPVETR